jgi:hypothetical protein
MFTIFYISYLNSQTIFNFLWHFDNLFIDFITPVGWLKCKYLGFDPYNVVNEYCKMQFAYGHIFLSIPYNLFLDFIYIKVLPYLLILLFITSVVYSINPRSLISLTLLFLALFNPSTTFILQKMNFDILIFLFVIFISLNRIYMINWFLLFFLTFTKIYPVISSLIIFLENKNRKIKDLMWIIFSITFVSIIYLFLNFEHYSNMLSITSANKAGFYFLFSLNSMPKIFNYLFNINYIFLLIIFYSFFIGIIIFLLKKKYFFKNINYKNFYNFNFKIFLISAYISIISFIFYSNWFHREIFIILTIPFIFSFYKNDFINIFNIIIFLLIFKYIYSFLYSYINVHDGITYLNNKRIFSNYFIFAIFFKSLIDFFFMILLSTITIFFSKKFYSQLKKRLF